MISVILPSRGRPERFIKCVEALWDTSHGVGYEVLVRLDEDDPKLKEYTNDNFPYCYPIVGKRGEGYSRNDALIEECAKESRGDLIMQFVDTAIMKTDGWPRLMHKALYSVPSDIVVMFPKVEPAGSYRFCFPTISRKLYETCGCFCLGQDPSVDRCWEAFVGEYPCEVPVDITVHHQELRKTKDEDQTAKESQPFYDELGRDWINRHDKHLKIGKQYAEIVRSKCP